MTPRRVWFSIAAVFILVAIYDTYLYLDDIKGNSITQVVRTESKRNPLLPAAIGAFLGGLFIHFFDTAEQQ